MRGLEVHVVAVCQFIADVAQVRRITIELHGAAADLVDERGERPHANAPPGAGVGIATHVVLPARLACDIPERTGAAPLLFGARRRARNERRAYAVSAVLVTSVHPCTVPARASTIRDSFRLGACHPHIRCISEYMIITLLPSLPVEVDSEKRCMCAPRDEDHKAECHSRQSEANCQ